MYLVFIDYGIICLEDTFLLKLKITHSWRIWDLKLLETLQRYLGLLWITFVLRNCIKVFDRHYDTRQINRYQEAILGVRDMHGPKDETLKWTAQNENERNEYRLAYKGMEELSSRQDPGVDLTSSTKPVPRYIRLKFR